MSEKAKMAIARRIDERGSVEFDWLKQELMDEFDVKWNTAQNYIYEYADYEASGADEPRMVLGMANEYKSALAMVGDDDESENKSQSDDKNEPDVRDLDEPIPPAVNEEFNHLQVRQPGHPLVPEVRSYVRRPMGGQEVSVDIDPTVTAIEMVSKAMASDDYGTMLIGEPGTGKGHMVRKICSETNRPMVRVNFGSRITKEKLVGGYVPRANGDGLDEQLAKAEEMAQTHDDLSLGDALETLNIREKFVWKDGLLTKAVRHGWVFLADELNAAPAETLMPLHGLLEDSSNRSLELTEKGEVVDVHDEFTFVGTMNPPHHPGTKQLNDALMGRLIPIEIPYLAPDAEAGLVAKQTGLTNSESETLVELASNLRNSYPREISTPCTPRELFKIGEMADIMNLKAATRSVLLSMTDSETEADAIEKRISMADF